MVAEKYGARSNFLLTSFTNSSRGITNPLTHDFALSGLFVDKIVISSQKQIPMQHDISQSCSERWVLQAMISHGTLLVGRICRVGILYATVFIVGKRSNEHDSQGTMQLPRISSGPLIIHKKCCHEHGLRSFFGCSGYAVYHIQRKNRNKNIFRCINKIITIRFTWISCSSSIR